MAISITVGLPGMLCGQSRAAAKLESGKEIFEAGCAGCHGNDGKGAPQTTTVFDRPSTFPDFTECSQTTPESDLTWKSMIRDGGPARAFSPIMPAFGDALTPKQINAVVKYMRRFCKENGWARGELNLPRALATEKAFPENEAVVTNSVNVHGSPGVSNELVQEQRIGMKSQLEISVPVDFSRQRPGLWYGGTGDVGIGLKRVLFSSLGTGSILSVQGEVIVPTGNRVHGLGSGVTTFETFAAFGQLLPWNGFVQLQGGAELPVDPAKAPQAVFGRAALGKSFAQNAGWGRLWSPMVELLADRDLVDGARVNWDIMPEFQVTLSKRQHIRFDVGLRTPVTNKSNRPMQVMVYLLWDWQDGKLWKGWR